MWWTFIFTVKSMENVNKHYYRIIFIMGFDFSLKKLLELIHQVKYGDNKISM